MVELIILAEKGKKAETVKKTEKDKTSHLHNNPHFEETRRCLLNMAHSRNQTHAGYLIAIVIGSLTLISRWDSFFSSPYATYAFFFLIGGITSVTIYMIKRMFFWNTYGSIILNLSTADIEKLFEEYKKEKKIFQKSPCPHTCILNGAADQRLKELRTAEKASDIEKFGAMDEKEFLQISIFLGVATAIFLLGFHLAGGFSLIIVLGAISLFLYFWPSSRYILYKHLRKYWK